MNTRKHNIWAHVAWATSALGLAQAAPASNSQIGNITNPMSAVNALYDNIETLQLTNNLVPLARAIIGALIAIAVLKGLYDTKSMAKTVLYGALAMSILASATSSGSIKGALWATWKATFTYAHDAGMASVSQAAGKAVYGLATEVGGGMGKIGARLAGTGMKNLGLGVGAIGMGTQSAGKINTANQKQLDQFQSGVEKLSENIGISTAAIVPFYATYVMIVSSLAIGAIAISIGYVVLLPALAAGKGGILLNLLFSYIGLLFATLMTPFLLGTAIQIGYILPINNTTSAIAVKFKDIQQHLSDTNFGNLFDSLGSVLGDIGSIATYAIISVVLVVTCSAAAIMLLAKAPDIIMKSLKP